jgi:zinc D-Ala-D-Ala dipeptidase
MRYNIQSVLLHLIVCTISLCGCVHKKKGGVYNDQTAKSDSIKKQSFTVSNTSTTQSIIASKYGVKAISSIDDYTEMIRKDSSKQLVDLSKIIPTIQLDIKYATVDNFMGRTMYSQAKAFLALPAAQALKVAQQQLNRLGYGLKIYDAYRPYSITVDFYEKVKDTVFVASAYKGSRHNRGCALDLTIINLKTGKELLMPTPFDDFSPKAHTNYRNLPSNVIKNRELLKSVMTQNGFDIYADEWWHYDFKNWRNHLIIDISFEQLLGLQQ